MKAFLLDAENRQTRTVEVNDADHLTDYYKYLNCELVDITSRKIGGKYFDIVADDEGLLKEPRIVSALDTEGQPALVGNLLFCNYDPETGEEVSLTDEDIQLLRDNVRFAAVRDAEGNEKEYIIVMANVDY